jgi:hypothetical protein
MTSSRTVRVAQFVNVLLFALVMGVFWGTWFSLSRSIGSIRPDTLASNWTAIRDRWELYHAIRTFVSLGALGFAIASALRWTPSLAREAR